MNRATKVFWAAVWIMTPALIFAALVAVIRPKAKDKAIDAQGLPEATLFFAEQREQNKIETTQAAGLHQRLQEARGELKKKRKISENQLLKQQPIEKLKEIFEKGEILWAPTEGRKYLETEQFKRTKQEEGRRDEARLKDEKLKENKVRNALRVTVLIITPALIFATMVALIRPKAKHKRRTKQPAN